jgi:ribosomal protein L35AE/L33A
MAPSIVTTACTHRERTLARAMRMVMRALFLSHTNNKNTRTAQQTVIPDHGVELAVVDLGAIAIARPRQRQHLPLQRQQLARTLARALRMVMRALFLSLSKKKNTRTAQQMVIPDHGVELAAVELGAIAIARPRQRQHLPRQQHQQQQHHQQQHQWQQHQ